MSESVRVDVFEAETHFTELLRQVHEGMSFTITQGGVAMADLVPTRAPDRRGKEAAEHMREFMRRGTVQRLSAAEIKELTNTGRD